MVRREKANYTIQSVSHAIDVLEQFASDAEELGVTELSKRLKLHKNNVFRLLATLESRGYIEQNQHTEDYRLGVRCLNLGQSYLARCGLIREATPVLEQLRDRCEETVFLAVRNGDGLTVLDVAEPDRAMRVVLRTGDCLSTDATAGGLVLQNGAESKACAIQRRSADPEVVSVAAPVADHRRPAAAAICVIGPRNRVEAQLESGNLADDVEEAANLLSTRLGAR